MRNRLFGLCLPPLLVGLFDGIITLIGQSKEYWAGNYSLAQEGNPTFYGMMIISPWAAVTLFAIWIGVYVGIILLVPDTLALIVSIAVTFSHAVGAATWLFFASNVVIKRAMRFSCSQQSCSERPYAGAGKPDRQSNIALALNRPIAGLSLQFYLSSGSV